MRERPSEFLREARLGSATEGDEGLGPVVGRARSWVETKTVVGRDGEWVHERWSGRVLLFSAPRVG